MNTQEIVKRLRIGFALAVGFAVGKFFATTMGHHASEFFIGGFGLGVILTHAAYWAVDALSNGGRSG
jgi:heme/copper-type cytochrome/quinol oxidase subunit 4